MSKVFKVKRQGKDANDAFWTFGKIHGLENIAFCDPAELAQVKGNPYKLQQLVNKVTPETVPGFGSHHEIESKLHQQLAEYKKVVDKMDLYPSDRKKLMALPFYMTKRQEDPTPRHGQESYQLFKEMTGNDWNTFSSTKFDPETKITEFDYENYLNPELIKGLDTKSAEFKDMIRKLNYLTKTRLEAHEYQKTHFRKLQGVLTGLNANEQRALIHLLKNKNGARAAEGQHLTEDLMDSLVDTTFEEELAAKSEEENFNIKNRYRHQKQTMDFADKKRMPVDETSVRDMLRHQHIFRNKMDQELPTYTSMMEGDQFEHGLLTYLREGAYGDLGDLVKEVGIKRDTIPFYNLNEFRKYKDNMIWDSDHQFQYLMSALFTPLDMTDYETNFVSWNELPGMVPISKHNWLQSIAPEPQPQIDSYAAIEEIEDIPRYGTSPTFTGIVQARYADVEEEEEEFYGSEGGDDDDDYGDEDEEEGDGEEEYGEYDEEAGDVEEWPPMDQVASLSGEDRFFRAGENLRGKYSEVEIESFMKLLGVKPRAQWQDTSTHHYKLGMHNYEDEAQETDKDFHLLSESERVHADRIKTKEWRSGSEIKLVVDGREPLRPRYRF